MERVEKTKKAYGLLWKKSIDNPEYNHTHFSQMQSTIPEKIVRGTSGIEVGSGCGFDTYAMAVANPGVKIVSLEISNGAYQTKLLTRELKNVSVIKGSAMELPIKDSSFDFAYSFGVLHHTQDPHQGMCEIRRVLKNDAPVFLYFYEDHTDNPAKAVGLKVVTYLRKLTVCLPPKLLFSFCFLVSPFVAIFFTLPARILNRFGNTRVFARKIPFNFGTHLFSLAPHLYDRFAAPIEIRFSRKEAEELFLRNGFKNHRISRMGSMAGWVAWGYRE